MQTGVPFQHVNDISVVVLVVWSWIKVFVIHPALFDFFHFSDMHVIVDQMYPTEPSIGEQWKQPLGDVIKNKFLHI